jgi:hypothetical protein
MAARTYDWTAISQSWSSSMGSPSTQAKYKAGVMRQTVSPTQLAAAPDAEARYVAGTQEAVTSGRRGRALQAVTLSDYQTAAVNKGAPRLGTGAVASQSKYARSMQPYTAVYAQIDSQLASMPKGGEANAIARAGVAIHALMAAAGRA